MGGRTPSDRGLLAIEDTPNDSAPPPEHHTEGPGRGGSGGGRGGGGGGEEEEEELHDRDNGKDAEKEICDLEGGVEVVEGEDGDTPPNTTGTEHPSHRAVEPTTAAELHEGTGPV